jgi:RNA polymerase sigma-70 factor, ECF subfamily
MMETSEVRVLDVTEDPMQAAAIRGRPTLENRAVVGFGAMNAAGDGDAPTSGSLPGAAGATSVHVRRAVRGDRESLSWVVMHFSPLLKAQASWRLGARLRGRVDPEDVVSEAWLVALRRMNDLVHDDGRSTPRFLAFLGTTVLRIVNRRIDEAVLRAQRTAPTPDREESPEPVDELQATVTGAVTHAARSELAASLEARLAELGEKDRQVVLLRIVEGLPNHEVARELGEPPNTVSHRCRRALAKLRQALPDSFLDEFEDA